MYRVRTRLRRRLSNLADKIMFGTYLISTFAVVGYLEGTSDAPFWPCFVAIAAGTLLSLRAGKRVICGA